jgi:hypothetical protein
MIWLAIAVAAEPVPPPTVTVQPDGTVICRAFIAANEQEVRAALQDPVKAALMTPDVHSATATKAGDCVRMKVETRGLWSPLKYTALRCPEKSGWRTTLETSEDFSAMESSWKLVPQEGGTDVELSVKSSPNLAVPKALITKTTQKSVLTTVKALLEKLKGR